jgi:hypothetical protein
MNGHQGGLVEAPLKVDAMMQLPRHVAREQATLSRPRSGIPGHGMDQHSNTSGQPVVTALRQNAGDRTCQHITHPGTRHAWIAPLAQGRRAFLGTDESASAFQDHRAAVLPDQAIKRRKSVRLYWFSAHVKQAPRFPWMGSQYPVVSRRSPAFRDQIQGIGVDNQRFVAAEYGVKGLAGPRCTAQSRPYRNYLGFLDGLGEYILTSQWQAYELGAAGRNGRHVRRGDRHRDQSGADPQTRLAGKTNRAGHAAAAADDQDTAEIAFVRGARTPWQGALDLGVDNTLEPGLELRGRRR